MRVLLLLLLLSAVVGFTEERPPEPTTPPAPARLSIPAQLSKTIDTNHCKPGDIVELRTLEPVLIGKGVVMPESAKLRGRIIGAGSRHDDKPSWLLLLVERADWKEHTLALHAFIAAQITANQLRQAGTSDATNGQTESVRRRQAMENSQSSRSTLAMRRRVQDLTVDTGQPMPKASQHLDDVHVVRDRSGSVFLLSQKSHLKIPSGTMLMLSHEPITASEAPAAAVAKSRPQELP
jgi:hypothetical protein